MRIGWLADPPGPIIGGAELSAATLRDGAPSWAHIVEVPPGQEDLEGLDAFIVQNCMAYGAGLADLFLGRPVIKVQRDLRIHGDLGQWLTQNAEAWIFSSDPHYRAYQADIGCQCFMCPPPVPVARFHKAAQEAGDRSGTFWMGQLFDHKGVQAAVGYAEANGLHCDFFGEGPLRPRPSEFCRYAGQIPYDDVPDLMATYEALLFLPPVLEPYSRVVIEAWAAGCKLIVNSNIGALWWLENHPDAIGQGVDRFWNIVREVLSC